MMSGNWGISPLAHRPAGRSASRRRRRPVSAEDWYYARRSAGELGRPALASLTLCASETAAATAQDESARDGNACDSSTVGHLMRAVRTLQGHADNLIVGAAAPWSEKGEMARGPRIRCRRNPVT